MGEKFFIKIFVLMSMLILILTCSSVVMAQKTNDGNVDENYSYEIKPSKNRKACNAIVTKESYYAQTYKINESLNLEGMEIMVEYDDLTRDFIDVQDERINVVGFDSGEVGSCYVRIYYKDKDINIKIYEFIATIEDKLYLLSQTKGEEKEEKRIQYVELYQKPKKTVYLLGEEFDYTGAKFKLFYDDDTEEIVDVNDERFEFRVDKFDSDYIGAKTSSLVLKNGAKSYSFSFKILVKENKNDKIVTDMLLIEYPDKWEINDGDVPNMEGATFQIGYDDGTSEIISYGDERLKYEYKNLYQDEYIMCYFFENKDYFDKFNSGIFVTVLEEEMAQYKTVLNDNTNYSANYRIEEKDLRREWFKDKIYNLSNYNFPDKYNLKDYLDILPTNQGGLGLCWDFATTKSLETNYYLKYGINYDLSERYIDYISSEDFYGSRKIGSGGYPAAHFEYAEKFGMPLESEIPYLDIDKSEYEKLENANNVVKIESGMTIYSKLRIEDNKKILNNVIKAHIMENGSLDIEIDGFNSENFKYNTYSYNKTENMKYSSIGHAVSVIGWDDNYSKKNFNVEPENDGAWIVQNSWGENWGEDGLFYISYDSIYSSLYGVLESAPVIGKKEYTYVRTGESDQLTYDNFDTEGKKYYYIEYEKKEDEEFLTNIIFDSFNSTTNVYLLDDYENNTVEEAVLLGSVSPKDSLDISNMIIREPIKLTGDKFLIILEMEGEYVEYYKNNNEIHTFYSDGEMTDEFNKYLGNLDMYVYTITSEQLEELEHNEVEKVKIVSEPTKKQYMQGESIDLTGGMIEVTYLDGRTEIKSMLDEDVYAYGYTSYNLHFGTQRISVVCGDEADTYNIEIRDDIEYIEMNTLPDVLTYSKHTDTLNLSTGNIKVYYSNGDEIIIDLDSDLLEIDDSDFNTDMLGKQTIIVKYANKETSFEIEVIAGIESIKFINRPNKTKYYTNESLELEDVILKIVYDDESTEIVNGSDETWRIEVLSQDWEKIEYDGLLKEKGEYLVCIYPKAEWDISADFEIKVFEEIDDLRNMIEIPTLLQDNYSYDYRYDEIEVELLGFNEEKMQISGETKGKCAGEYVVEVALKDTATDVWYIGEEDYSIILSDEPQRLIWNIEPGICWTYFRSQEEIYVYTGEEQAWSGSVVEYDKNIVSLSVDNQTDVGIYKAILSLKDKQNYTWNDGSVKDKTSEWKIAKATPVIEILNKNQVESEIEAIQVEVTPKMTDGEINVLYSENNGIDYTKEVPTKGGLYKIRVTLSGDKNLHDTEIEDFLLIEGLEEKTIIPIPTLVSEDLVYTGEEQIVINGLYDEIMEYSGHKATNVGKYEAIIKIKDKEKYQWSDNTQDDKKIGYEIQKATWDVVIQNKEQVKGKVKDVKVTVTPQLTDGIINVTYQNGNKFTEKLPSAVGTHKVKVEISGDTNLQDGEKELELIIKKPTNGGGGSSPSTKRYRLRITQTEGGRIEVDEKRVKEGGNQQITIIPDDGYRVKKVIIDGTDLGAITTYLLKNVKKNNTLIVDFEKIIVNEEDTNKEENQDITIKNNFDDVLQTDWYYSAINYVVEKGLFKGVSDTEFAPNKNMNRAMIVTVLHRLAGEEKVYTQNPFKDIEEDSYYQEAIKWSYMNNIVNGVNATEFAPLNSVTREQLVTILYRYAKILGCDMETKENIAKMYLDSNNIETYAQEAFDWAIENRLITGRTETTLAPKGIATRAEVATILMRFEQMIDSI